MNKNMKWYLGCCRSMAIMWSATAALILVSILLRLGLFSLPTVLAFVGVSFGLTCIAMLFYVFFFALVLALTIRQKVRSVTVMSTFGVFGGTFAIGVFDMFFPAMVHIGYLGATTFAIANVALIWTLGLLAGVVRKDLTL